MTNEQLETILNSPKPVSKSQRHSCYRLGLSEYYVRKWLTSYDAADVAIKSMVLLTSYLADQKLKQEKGKAKAKAVERPEQQLLKLVG